MNAIEILRQKLDRLLERSEGFQETSLNVSRSIHQAVLDNGEKAREVADVLHGKQIGHALHPILTDVTIGSWTLGVMFDALSYLFLSRTSRKAANRLITLGTISAVPTALAGIMDYSTIKQNAASYGALHGLLNSVAFFLFFRSVKARFSGHYIPAFFYSFIGLGFAMVSAWLGGDLVYRHRIGVNHAQDADGPAEWTSVLPVDELGNRERLRVEVDDLPVMLYREDDDVYAIGAVCSHAGGPLEEGMVDNLCVQCPWHDSVFDLRDGHVVHGPATFAVAAYETRIFNGQIQVRRSQPELEIDNSGLSDYNMRGVIESIQS